MKKVDDLVNRTVELSVGNSKFFAYFTEEYARFEDANTHNSMRWITVCVLHSYSDEYGHEWGSGIAIRNPKDKVNSKYAYFLALKRASIDVVTRRLLANITKNPNWEYFGLDSFTSTLNAVVDTISQAFANYLAKEGCLYE